MRPKMNMTRRASVFISAILTIWTTPAWAAEADPSVVYVTDELRLGLYRTEETSGRALRTLISGSRLEVLERSLMSIRVRTEEGDEGWVKTAYLVPDEPARLRLAVLEEVQAGTATALAARDAEVETLTGRLDELEQALATAKKEIVELPAIRAENVELKNELTKEGFTVPLFWLVLAAAASAIAGILIGYWWLDRKIRQKFGGVRVY